MARPKKQSNITVRGETSRSKDQSLFEKLQLDLSKNQSYLNLILGALIVLVLGVLLFNYFNRQPGDLGPSNQAETQEQAKSEDVSKENLPGKYTVKEGDTLFLLAQKYYDNGYLYTEIAKANNLKNENTIEVGQVLEIPKIETAQAQASPTPQVTPAEQAAVPDQATGGAENQTVWGEKITGDTYTVVEGDWLSTIAGRAYGDIMVYQRIADANNIQNPDLIEVGQVLKIPR